MTLGPQLCREQRQLGSLAPEECVHVGPAWAQSQNIQSETYSMVVHPCNPKTLESEARWDASHELHIEIQYPLPLEG